VTFRGFSFLGLILPPLLAGLWAAALGIEHVRGDMWFLGRVEATMTDLRTALRGERRPPDLVTIVAIDDALVSREGGYPLSRTTVARIVDAIARAKPRAIGLDMLLVDRGPEDGDKALTEALERLPTVIATAAIFANSTQTLRADGGLLSDIPVADKFLAPLPRFASASTLGVVNVAVDEVGTPRAVPMVFSDGRRIELSFPLRLVAMAEQVEPAVERDGVRLGNRFVPTDLGHALPLAFFGPSKTIRTVPASGVLDGIAGAALVDRIVIIGVTVTGGGDVFPSPFDAVMPGVEVMATAVDNLATGDGLVRGRTVRLADAAIAVLLSMLTVGLLAWRRSAASFALIAALVAAWAVSNVLAFMYGLWLSVALPVTAAAPPAIAFGALQLWLQRRSAHHFASQSRLLQRVHAAGFSEWLAANPDFLVKPVRQDAAILFIDMSGFTALSERIGPDAVRELLDGFYRLIDEVCADSGGAITSFAGDGAMLVFGLPRPSDKDAFNAAEACVRLIRRTHEWRLTLGADIGPLIGFKMGAHFGPVVASRLGGERNQQITATGDTVNVANRLMEITAERGADVAVSKRMLDAAGPECALFKLGVLSGQVETRLRGRARPLDIRVWWDSVG
jgi:adenylate cyclase